MVCMISAFGDFRASPAKVVCLHQSAYMVACRASFVQCRVLRFMGSATEKPDTASDRSSKAAISERCSSDVTGLGDTNGATSKEESEEEMVREGTDRFHSPAERVVYERPTDDCADSCIA